MIDGIEWPAVDSVWSDSRGRQLTVLEVRPRDACGRNVVGVLRELVKVRSVLGGVPRLNEVVENAYACDLQTFRIIWHRAT